MESSKEKKARILIEKIKEKVKPGEEEKKRVYGIGKKIEEKFKRIFKEQYVKLLGSVGKGTFLKGDVDFDIFIFYKPDISRKEMERQFFKRLKEERISYTIAYADHPYAKTKYLGYDVDLVPAYKIKKGQRILSPVDRSLFHYEYIEKNLKEEEKDEVRVLKLFLKNFNIYGSEIYVKGFSGYLCELLIIKYHSLINLLKSARTWRYPHIITFDSYKLKKGEMKKFENQPLIVIDPVDKNRNVASALSVENYARFVSIAKAFLNSPSLRFFKLQKAKIEKKQEENIYIIELPSPDKVKDIKLGQLKRMERALTNHLYSKGFLMNLNLSFEKGKTSYIVVSIYFKPSKRIIRGPMAWLNNVERFVKEHKDVILYKERFYASKSAEKVEKEIKDFLKGYKLKDYDGKKAKISSLKSWKKKKKGKAKEVIEEIEKEFARLRLITKSLAK